MLCHFVRLISFSWCGGVLKKCNQKERSKKYVCIDPPTHFYVLNERTEATERIRWIPVRGRRAPRRIKKWKRWMSSEGKGDHGLSNPAAKNKKCWHTYTNRKSVVSCLLWTQHTKKQINDVPSKISRGSIEEKHRESRENRPWLSLKTKLVKKMSRGIFLRKRVLKKKQLISLILF